MVGHRPFKTLTKGWTAERKAEVAQRAAELKAEMATLEELRRELGMSQQEIASLLDVEQPHISKLEKRADMHVSTLRDLVKALGGELKITANFAGKSVEISNFQNHGAV